MRIRFSDRVWSFWGHPLPVTKKKRKKKVEIKLRTIYHFTATACKISRMKCTHTRHACRQCIWWSYNKSPFHITHFDRNPFTSSCEEENIRVFVGFVASDVLTAICHLAIVNVCVIIILSIGNTQISILLLCFLCLFVELMITMNESNFVKTNRKTKPWWFQVWLFYWSFSEWRRGMHDSRRVNFFLVS